MDAKISTFSILLVSLLSLFTTTSVAHNRFLIPSSCIGHPGLLKCALDYESAIKAAASADIHISASALSVVLDSIFATKAAGVSIVHFLSHIHTDLFNEHATVERISKLNSTIGVAVHELVKASTVIRSEAKLSMTELHNIEKSLKIASAIATKLHVGVGFKPTDSDADVLLNSMIEQFINLTNLTLKVIGTIKANSKFSF